MKGYRTLAINVAGMLVAVLAGFGVIVPAEMMTEITVGVFALINFGMRFITDSKVGEP